MSQATAKLQGMLQGVNVTDAVIANVQITAALLAATLLDIKDQAMKLGVLGPAAAHGDLLKSCSFPAILPLRNHAD
jgi:hypothetical protein